MKLSYIVPVYNGEHTVGLLFDAIQNSCNKYGYEFEVIFVWDCGHDGSWKKLEELKNAFPNKIKAIHLTRNYGQHNAIICGSGYAQGIFFVTIDEDLQHDPDEVPLLIQKQEEGDFDVVYGHYPERQHNWIRNITSKILRVVLKIGLPELHSDYSAYRLIKKDIALATSQMQNSYTFLDGYLTWITRRVGSVNVSHYKRCAGVSSYSTKKLINHTINIFVTFSDLPIRIVTTLSILFLVFTFGYSIYILFQKLLLNNLIPGFASLIVLIGFGIGSILLGISVIGAYIHRINLKTTRRPNYLISKFI